METFNNLTFLCFSPRLSVVIQIKFYFNMLVNNILSINDKYMLIFKIYRDILPLNRETDHEFPDNCGGIDLMKWNNQKSIVLTKVCIAVFSLAYVLVLLLCPWLVKQFVTYSFSARSKDACSFMLTVYACAIPLGLILWHLYQLVLRIEKEEIFTDQNTKSLRLMGWMCFAVAVIFLVSTCYYTFYLIFAACAVLMGLLLRVLKNVFVQAKEMKEENDYTI